VNGGAFWPEAGSLNKEAEAAVTPIVPVNPEPWVATLLKVSVTELVDRKLPR